MPYQQPQHDETRPHRRQSADATGPVRAVTGGLMIKWGTILTSVVVLGGAGWGYADGRWSRCELATERLTVRADELRERALIVEQQAAAAQRQADERHADLRAHLVRIEAQLVQIQMELRRGAQR